MQRSVRFISWNYLMLPVFSWSEKVFLHKNIFTSFITFFVCMFFVSFLFGVFLFCFALSSSIIDANSIIFVFESGKPFNKSGWMCNTHCVYGRELNSRERLRKSKRERKNILEMRTVILSILIVRNFLYKYAHRKFSTLLYFSWSLDFVQINVFYEYKWGFT